MTRPTNLAMLESCSLLNAMPADAKQALADECYAAYAERGDVLWLAGDPAAWFGIVGTGFVKICKLSPKGAQVTCELVGPGQAIGLIVALEHRPYPLSAIAASATWYLKAPVDAFERACDSYPRLKDAVILAIGPRIRQSHERMMQLSSNRVEERIAAVLLILAGGHGDSTPEGVRLRVPLTRQDVAEMAGTTVESAIRVMSRWQKEDILRTERQHITLHNPDALRALMQEA